MGENLVFQVGVFQSLVVNWALSFPWLPLVLIDESRVFFIVYGYAKADHIIIY